MGDILRLDRSDNYKVRAAEAKAIAERDVAKYRTGKTSQTVALPPSLTAEPLPKGRSSTEISCLEVVDSIRSHSVECPINAHPLESTLYDDTINAKMMRTLKGVKPSKLARLNQLIIRIKDVLSPRKIKKDWNLK